MSILNIKNLKLNEKLALVILVGLAILFQVITFINTFIGGIYSWHISRPQVYESGIIVLSIFVFLTIVSVFSKKVNVFAIINLLVILIFLRLYGCLIPALATIVYFEIIISVGLFTKKIFGQRSTYTGLNYINSFTIGLVIWLLCALFLSMIGAGRFNHLRIMTIVIGCMSYLKGFNKPLIYKIFSDFNNSQKYTRIMYIFIEIIIVIQLAKSNISFNHDCLWYGLRPEFVLIGEHSFYDYLGLNQFVFYYPKMMELFYVPLSNLGDYSFIYSANTYVYFMILLVVFIIGTHMNLSKNQSLFCTLLISCIPAISNMASTSKTDLFTTLLMLIGVANIIIFVKVSNIKYIIFSFVPLVLSFGSKYTSILYVPFVLIGLFILLIYKLRIKELVLDLKQILKNKFEILIFLLSCIDLFGILFRTYKITGYPFLLGESNKIYKIFEALGFRFRYPFYLKEFMQRTRVESIAFGNILERIYIVLLNPQKLLKILTAWYGNIGFFLIVCTLASIVLYMVKPKFKIMLLFSPIISFGLFLMLIYRNGGDGNYFIFPVIIIIIVNFQYIFTQVTSKVFKKSICILLLLFIPLQTFYTFVSHGSWKTGLTRDNISITRDIIDTDDWRYKQINKLGMNRIIEYIEPFSNKSRILAQGIEKEPVWLLKGRVERIDKAFGRYLGISGVLKDKGKLFEYLDYTNIDFIILPNDYEYIDDVFKDLFIELKEDKRSFLLIDKRYMLLDISQITGNNLLAYELYNTRYKDIELLLGENMNNRILDAQNVNIDKNAIRVDKGFILLEDEEEYGNNLNISMDIKLNEYPCSPVQLVSKYAGWQDNMSYVMALNNKHLYLVFSQNGKKGEGIWIEREKAIKPDQWTKIVITFNNGVCIIKANNNILAKKEFSFNTFFESDLPIKVVNGMNCNIKNLVVSYTK